MRGRTEQLTLAALAALGSLVIHQLAYLAAYPVEATRAAQLADHGHMTAQFALIVPVAVLAATGFVLRQVQGLGLGARLSTRRLMIVALAFFVMQEAAEAAIRGESPLLVVINPAVLLGLLFAPFVALGFRCMLEVAEGAVRRLRRSRPVPAGACTLVVRPRPHLPLIVRFLSSGPTRGPPLVRC